VGNIVIAAPTMRWIRPAEIAERALSIARRRGAAENDSMTAADHTIFAAIEAHRAALDALDQCVATLGDGEGVAPVFAELQRRERAALWALTTMTPSTAAGYRAIAQHLVAHRAWNDWPDGTDEKLLRAFAGEPA
jgi:hypothetical protein